jgi:hypothetical protein
MSGEYTKESWEGLEKVKEAFSGNEAVMNKLALAFYLNREDFVAVCERLSSADDKVVIEAVKPILEKLIQPGRPFGEKMMLEYADAFSQRYISILCSRASRACHSSQSRCR